MYLLLYPTVYYHLDTHTFAHMLIDPCVHSRPHAHGNPCTFLMSINYLPNLLYAPKALSFCLSTDFSHRGTMASDITALCDSDKASVIAREIGSGAVSHSPLEFMNSQRIHSTGCMFSLRKAEKSHAYEGFSHSIP